jgi:hypothetical protein
LIYPVLFLCYLADWPWCHDMLLFWVPMWYWSNGLNSFVLESCRASVWEYVLHHVWLIWLACLLSWKVLLHWSLIPFQWIGSPFILPNANLQTTSRNKGW